MHLHRWSSPEGNRGRRAYAYLYSDDERSTFVQSHVEAYVASGSRMCGIHLGIGDESMVGGSIRVPKVASMWWGIGSPSLDRWLYLRGVRRLHDINLIDVAVHDGAIWWEFVHPKHEWKSGTSRWRHGNWHPLDTLLGRRVHSKEIIDGPIEVVIPMPERGYDATVTIELARWKRPRWPWATELRRYNVEIPGGIPVPGKGENSWDCGDDAIFGQSGPGRSVEVAIGNIVESALTTRKRHGGRHTIGSVS
jgi:hypothetical protein